MNGRSCLSSPCSSNSFSILTLRQAQDGAGRTDWKGVLRRVSSVKLRTGQGERIEKHAFDKFLLLVFVKSAGAALPAAPRPRIKKQSHLANQNCKIRSSSVSSRESSNVAARVGDKRP
ncbi:MAG: hypothetical protein LBD67_00270 [Candidatus Accumulibacter sp.]|nr:hypothetical protein [Accumulibacter sp.]